MITVIWMKVTCRTGSYYTDHIRDQLNSINRLREDGKIIRSLFTNRSVHPQFLFICPNCIFSITYIFLLLETRSEAKILCGFSNL